MLDEAIPASQLVNARIEPVAILSPTAAVADVVAPPDLDLRVGLQGDVLTYALTSADGCYTEQKLGQVSLSNNGALLLTMFQVDETANGRPRSCRASTTWPTPSRSRSTAAGRAGARGVTGDLVIGVDVGSQGTCAQLIEAERQAARRVVRRASTSPTRAPAGPSRIRASGCRRSPRRCAR